MDRTPMIRTGELEYFPDTGEFFWRGRLCQSCTGDGYRRVSISGRRSLAHRVAWELAYGPIPEDKVVDHIDRDKLNNRLSNLRLVSKSENALNCGTWANNTSGHRGIDWRQDRQCWRARLNVGGRTVHTSNHKTFNAAVAAFRTAAEQHKVADLLWVGPTN
ncbi:putative HNH endonuclease [Pseudomonas phage Ep4]|uniref:HNH endonuclease n=1 Tax=Pseudomonas phage Ep4 TaxID=3057492 RepID=A0AAU9EQL8_9CAUD|nr:putative HNH endonuclease [Pseudomonas phage Ep4]